MHTHSQAMLWMLLACFTTSILVSIVKHLAESLPIFEILFFRNGLALLFLMPWAVNTGLGSVVRSQHWRLYVKRGAAGIFGMGLWWQALATLEMPLAVSLSFTAPLITALLSILIFGEKYGVHRWSALLIGFAGTLVILRPGTESFDSMMLLVIVAASFWSLSGIITKQLTNHGESTRKITFHFVLFLTPASLPFALLDWTWPTAEEWLWLLALGFAANAFQLCLSRAISLADFAVILPIDYTRLLFATIFAYYFWQETIDLWTVVGSILVMAGAVYTAWRERMHRRRKKQHGNYYDTGTS